MVPVSTPSQAPFQSGDRLRPCNRDLSERFADNSLDCGTGFDCFDPRSHTAHPALAI